MDTTTCVDAFLLPYSQAITVLSTAIIAISAVTTAALTWRLIRDNRNLQRVGTDPEVVAYLVGDPFQPLTNFVLANVGRGPAKNVQFEFDLQDPHFKGILLRNDPNRRPFGFLLQGEKREMLFGDHRMYGRGEYRDRETLPPFQVVVRWNNLRGRKFEATYTLDVRQFFGIPPTASLYSPLSKIADSLAKIERNSRQ